MLSKRKQRSGTSEGMLLATWEHLVLLACVNCARVTAYSS